MITHLIITNNYIIGLTKRIGIQISDEEDYEVALAESQDVHIYVSPKLVRISELTLLAGEEARFYHEAVRIRERCNRFVRFVCFWRKGF